MIKGYVENIIANCILNKSYRDLILAHASFLDKELATITAPVLTLAPTQEAKNIGLIFNTPNIVDDGVGNNPFYSPFLTSDVMDKYLLDLIAHPDIVERKENHLTLTDVSFMDKRDRETWSKVPSPIKIDFGKLRAIVIDKLGKQQKPRSDQWSKKALLLVLKDTSGSIGVWENRIAKAVADWAGNLLTYKYKNYKTAYIGHGTEAKVYDSKEVFFAKGEGGGTICSTVLKEAYKEIITKYDDCDVYVVYVSDGDNLTSDNERFVKRLNALIEEVRGFTLVELNQYNRPSTLGSVTRHFKHTRFSQVKLREDSETYKALEAFSNHI